MMEFRPGTGLAIGTALILACAGGINTPALADEKSSASTYSSTAEAADAVSPDGYTSAFVCGRCHADIYNSWKRSMHALSLTDPVFDVAYMQATKADPASKTLCLKCHAPATMLNEDYDLTLGLTREGVTCDFCHTVTGVDIGNRAAPYVQELGRVKRSTLADANSPAHDVAYSTLHASSEFCGACHHHETDNGTVVMGTYTEWKEGPYAKEGVQCQDCHMVLTRGHVVQPEVKKGGDKINLHDLIHDSDQLKKALEVRIVDVSPTAGGLVAKVQVANVGSGHMIPTGIPNRTVVLQVKARHQDGTVQRQEKVYKKVVGGPNGRPLAQDFEVFLYAESILSDNRIGPKEKREETFFFKTAPNEEVEISAAATYEYAPLVLDKRAMTITLSSDSRTTKGGR